MYSAALSSRDNPHSSYPHPPSPVSLSLSLPLFLFSSTSTSTSLSLSPVSLFPFFCLGLAFLFVPDSPLLLLLDPDWAPSSSAFHPISSSRSPPAHTKQHQQQSPANSIAFPTLFILDRLVSSRCFPCNDLYDLVPVICYSRVFSCFPVEVEREKTLASID